MTKYLISFDDGSMDHIRDEEWTAVAEASILPRTSVTTPTAPARKLQQTSTLSWGSPWEPSPPPWSLTELPDRSQDIYWPR